MEQYLRAHVSYLQDDWPTWLPLAQFTANNQASETTSASPFFGMYGSDLVWQCDLMPPAAYDADDRRAHSKAQTLAEIDAHLRAELGRAQDCHAMNADRGRIPAPRFLPGDQV